MSQTSGLSVTPTPPPPRPYGPTPAGKPGPHVVVILGTDRRGGRYITGIHGLYPGEDAAADAASGIIAGRAGRRAEIYPCHPPVPAWSLDQAQPGDVVRSRNVNTWYWRNEPIGGLSPWVMTAGPKGFIGSRSTSAKLAELNVELVTRGTGAER